MGFQSCSNAADWLCYLVQGNFPLCSASVNSGACPSQAHSLCLECISFCFSLAASFPHPGLSSCICLSKKPPDHLFTTTPLICSMFSLLYFLHGTCTCMLNRFSRVRPFVTPWTVAHQAPLSLGILQARILEWVAMPSSRGSS